MNLEEAEVGQDCIFIFEDQKLFANKVKLGSISPVFNSMFYGPMASNEIEITDSTADDFNQMLDYIITNEIIFKSINNAWSIYYISQKYFIQDLKQHCLDYISSNWTLSTLLLSYEYSQLYNLKDLTGKCWREILLCAKEVLNTDYHMKAATFCALLDENSINATEEDLIQAAIRWAKNECVSNNFDADNEYNVLAEAGIFQRLRFASLGHCFLKNVKDIIDNDRYVINQNSEKRCRVSKIYLALRFRFREAYKIERNISLMSESEFYCNLKASRNIVVYGIAIAQPHQGGLVTAVSNSEVSIFDPSSRLLGKAEHSIVTKGDYEVPRLVHFGEGIQFESEVPYKICVKYYSASKKPNELLCFYLSHNMSVFNNSVKLQFDDGLYGGVLRGVSCYPV